MWKSIYKWSRGYYQPSGPIFSFHRNAFVESRFLVRFFYLLTLYTVLNALYINAVFWVHAKSISPLWPIAWVSLSSHYPQIIYTIVLGTLISNIMVFCFPEKRLYRFLFSLTFFGFAALANSFGKINHGYHAMIIIAFLFLFLPKDPWSSLETSISKRQYFLAIIWAAQLLFLLFYTMSGLHKLYALINQIRFAPISALHPQALAYQTAWRLLMTNEESLLGSLLIKHAFLGWPLYLGAIGLEVFAVVAAFRPALHRLWGIGLMTLHIGTGLLMNVTFLEHVLLAGLFLVYSPFRPRRHTLANVGYALPLIGDLLRFVVDKRGRRRARQRQAPSGDLG